MTAPVTAATVRNLAAVLDGVRHGARIWLHVDTERQWGGVMRQLCDAEGDGTQGSWDEGDVRDKFVRISSTLEQWLPVADIARPACRAVVGFPVRLLRATNGRLHPGR